MITANVMTDPVTVTPDTTLADAARVMLARRAGSVQVIDDAGLLVGMLTESDLLRRPELETEGRHVSWLKVFLNETPLTVDYTAMHNLKVSDVMTRELLFAAPEDSLMEVAVSMQHHDVKRLPVVEDGTLVGIIGINDLLGVLNQQLAAAR